MVDSLTYSTICLILDSWDALQRVPDYEEKAGRLLFQRMFVKCPRAKALFGIPMDADPYSPDLVASKRFIMHSTYLIQMLSVAVNMLGPDVELLTEILLELGQKHVRYGVTMDMFPVIGQALLNALNEMLGDEIMNEATQRAWTETYSALSADMMRAQRALRLGQNDSL